MQHEKYDSALLAILQNEGGLPKFLDAIFGFLYRRTDYYVHLTPEGRMGFAPGVAKKLVLTAFKRYEELAVKDEARREAMKIQAEQKLQHQLQQNPIVPDCIRVEEVTTSEEEVTTMGETRGEINSTSCPDTSIEASSVTTATTPSVINSATQSQDHLHTMADHEHEVSETAPTTTESVISSTAHELAANSTTAMPADPKAGFDAPPTIDVDDDEQTKLQKIFQANSESYNGAIRDHYSWSQSITDVDIRVKVPKHILKGRDVTVEISRKHLKATYKDSEGKFVVAVDDHLPWEINKEESMWSLVPGEHIHVNVEKCEERWWESLLISEPKISVRKIDPSRPMTDLEDGAQAKIEEMMYNEQQKRLGLPQSHEKKMHDMLRDAWDVEGSPFKGQPFDPSQINISPNNMG